MRLTLDPERPRGGGFEALRFPCLEASPSTRLYGPLKFPVPVKLVSSGLLQQRGDILQISFRCLLQWGMAGVIRGIRIGASRQQQANDLEPVLSYRKHQGRAARVVSGIDDRSSVQQCCGLRHVALRDGRF